MSTNENYKIWIVLRLISSGVATIFQQGWGGGGGAKARWKSYQVGEGVGVGCPPCHSMEIVDNLWFMSFFFAHKMSLLQVEVGYV